MPIRSATGYTSWRYLRGVPDAPGAPQAVSFAPPPFAAGDAVLVTFTETWPAKLAARRSRLVIITETPAVVLSCQPGLVPTVRVRFTAGGLAGGTAGVPVSRVRLDPGVRR